MVSKQDFLGFAIFLFVDIAFAIWWIRMRLGLDKRWFVMPARTFVSRNFYFALPTFVLATTVFLGGLLLIIADPHKPEIGLESYLILVAFGVLLLGFIFAYLEPDWMSPAWYRWLKHEHGDILPYLAQEAHEMGRAEWLARVQTQEDLEQWVAEFRRKHGL